jgi:release factor glutamine methyltransferase
VVTWRQLWRETTARIADPVQARWLLEEASGSDRTALLRGLDCDASPQAAETLETLVERLVAGEPLQHVLGHWGFRGIEVLVDSRVLVPRPETEQVVTFALRELDRVREVRTTQEATGPVLGLSAVDLGTGSGVIALSLVSERADVRVVATDRDSAALEVAARNLSAIATEAAARVQLVAGDWYQALPAYIAGHLDLVVSNPPYLAEREWSGLERTVRDFDPLGALVAGPSGLEAIETIVSGAPGWLAPIGALVVEIAPDQARAALELANDAGFVASSVEQDLAGRPRVLVART